MFSGLKYVVEIYIYIYTASISTNHIAEYSSYMVDDYIIKVQRRLDSYSQSIMGNLHALCRLASFTR